MKFSITNISWGTLRIEDLGSELKNIGIQGIEIAPTLIWKDLAGASTENVLKYKKINFFYFKLLIALLFSHSEK